MLLQDWAKGHMVLRFSLIHYTSQVPSTVPRLALKCGTRAVESELRSELESNVLAGFGVRAGVGKIWLTLTPAWSHRLTPGDRI